MKTDMKELDEEIKRIKKENPNKKVSYFFITDKKYPKGYKIVIKDETHKDT